MNYKVIFSTNHPVVWTYMQLLKKSCMATGKPVEEIIEINNKKRNSNNINKKTDCFVVDSPIVALRYYLHGARNFITWYQGIVPEESYMNNHSRPRRWILSKIEKIFLKKSKLLLLVSENMLKHYEKKYKLSLKDKSVIMPCFNETEIVEDAFFEDKYKKNTFLYVGGMAKWQCFEQIAKLYSEIEKTNGNTMFYVYTFNKDVAEAVIKSLNIKNYLVDYAPKNELSEKIKGMKYGFVLREDCTVNNVATPTKFSNYLANGIVPIYSSSLRSFADVDAEAKIGIVCNVDDLDTGAKRILEHMELSVNPDEMKKKCQSVFAAYYNQDMYVEKIKRKLTEL